MKGHPLTDGMNPQQVAAITTGGGPVLVLAGPGSGKTSVLTRRIAFLILEGRVPHHRIMAVTFTNKAAGEMRGRVEALLGDRLRGLQIGTFHATCARFLRRDAELLGYGENWVIYDRDDSLAMIKRVMKLLDIDIEEYRPRDIMDCIAIAKCELIAATAFDASDCFREIVRQVYVAYQHSLVAANAMDFGDLLLNMTLLLREREQLRREYQHRFEHVLVDEFQDTNHVQNELVKLLAAPKNNLFTVGDEDQSIYAFRGADLRNMLGFRNEYPDAQEYLLEQNYRSTQYILSFARCVIDQNPYRTPRALFSDLGLGERVRLTEEYDVDTQAEYVLEQINTLCRQEGLTFDDIAVMYRTNWHSRAIEQQLMRNDVPYVMLGGQPFYERREVKDMLAYLRLVHNPDDQVSFNRVVNTPRRGIGNRSLAAFHSWVTHSDMTLAEALDRIVAYAPAAMTSVAYMRIRAFAILLNDWRKHAAQGDLVKLLDAIVALTDYQDHLKRTSKSEEEYVERWSNAEEIMRMLQRAEDLGQSLADFVIEQTLYTDAQVSDGDVGRVSLTTLHSSKGLEFSAVFIICVEKGTLPHPMAHHAICNPRPGGEEEERRLFYVGITRAKRRLYLSYTFGRGLSPFLYDTPPILLDAPPLVLDSVNRAQSIEAQTQSAISPHPPNRLDSDMK